MKSPPSTTSPLKIISAPVVAAVIIKSSVVVTAWAKVAPSEAVIIKSSIPDTAPVTEIAPAAPASRVKICPPPTMAARVISSVALLPVESKVTAAVKVKVLSIVIESAVVTFAPSEAVPLTSRTVVLVITAPVDRFPTISKAWAPPLKPSVNVIVEPVKVLLAATSAVTKPV